MNQANHERVVGCESGYHSEKLEGKDATMPRGKLQTRVVSVAAVKLGAETNLTGKRLCVRSTLQLAA